MKTFTASLLALGISAVIGVSTEDAIGDHGQPEAPPRVESTPVTRPVESPQTPGPAISSRDARCGAAIPQCDSGACPLTRHGHRQATPAEVAAELHSSAAMLVEDVDFDLYGTRDFAHLIRDAEIIVRDVIEVRRALARRDPMASVAADLRNTASSLNHLERAIGRRYRTRAIHFSLLDSKAALNDLAGSLNVDLSGETSLPQPAPATSAPQLQPNDPASRQPPVPPTNPQTRVPPVPPALQLRPELPQTAPETLVVPEPSPRGLAMPDTMKGIRQLGPSDQGLAMRQRTCPVTGDLLGSMGKPIKVNVDGRTVFVCCQGCVEEVRSSGRPSQ